MEIFNRDTDSSIGYLLGRTSRVVVKRLSRKFAKAGFDITQEQWSLIIHLYKKDGQTQNELSKKIVKDKAAITRILNTLEKKNIVLRVPGKSDKRARYIYLTNQAKEFRDELVAVADEFINEAEQGIPQKDMKFCKEVLNKIFYNIEDRIKHD